MCSFALPASAADGTENIISSEIDGVFYHFYDKETGWVETTEFETGIFNSSVYPQFNGFLYIKTPYLPGELTGPKFKYVVLTEDLSLQSNHEYSLNFDYGYLAVDEVNSFSVSLLYYDANGNETHAESLYSFSPLTASPVNVSFNFKLDEQYTTKGYSCKISFTFFQSYNANYTSGNSFYFLSDEIELIDKDDDSGWFQKIINKIEETISNIKQIPEKINQKLTELKESITNAFVELKENLIEGLKGLFVPSDGFFEEKKAELELFLEDHFGILWTAPNIMISTIEQLLTMSPEEPSITMPAIQFTWENELITLTEPMTVHFNDYIGEGTPLETFYNFYRVFVTIILIFLFINYCLKKYHYIFGKDGEAVEH